MALQNLLNQTITTYARSSYDADGREVLGSAVSRIARFQEVTKSKLQANGQSITIDAIAYLHGEVSIDTNDRVDYGGRKFKVHGRSVAVDGQGNADHTKLELVKWSL